MNDHALFLKMVHFTTAVHQVKHDITKDIRLDDITPAQYGILEYIAVSQPVALSQISDCQQMSMPNTSREIKKLIEKQFCEKSVSSEDRRKQYIKLSSKGQALMNQVFEHIQARFEERIGNASAADRQLIEQAIDLLYAKVFYSETI